MQNNRAVVIGAGFSGLSAACFLAADGWQVTVLEKNEMPGGRARKFEAAGFTFDMGPSWYWMPDVFENFFKCFGRSVSEFYTLQRLDPSYRVYWNDGCSDLPADLNSVKRLFEGIETGSATKLDDFLEEAGYKYRTGMGKLVFKPGLSVAEFLEWDVVKGLFRLDLFKSVKTHIARYFKDPKLQQLLEFPVLFLGALPENTPALYSLMNFADMVGGTWFPKGGMYSIVEGMYKLSLELGVTYHFNCAAEEIEVQEGRVSQVITAEKNFKADTIIASADYHHIEEKLLKPVYRTYTESYWESRTMAPGCLLYYVGIKKKLTDVQHHSLFFDADFNEHAKDIYTSKKWPANPLFYVSIPSKTDESLAPEGHENLFFLIPVAAGLNNDTEEIREQYFDVVVKRFERHIGQEIRSSIVFSRSYAHSDFITDYNSFKGNAYGLANTLMQTAILKPSIKSKKVKNLYFAGQLTVPGPGVPPAIISGQIAATLAGRENKRASRQV